MIDGAVIVGVAVVAPLALGGWRRWTAAAGLVTVALHLAPGITAGCVAAGPAALAGLVARREIAMAHRNWGWGRESVVRALAAAWIVVAMGALVASRLGAAPFGIHEPIVELTAVHYLFAGVGALTLAGASRSSVAVALTAAAPPVVALGFVTGGAAPQVGGAILMATGVFAIAALEIRAALSERDSPWYRRLLLATSGLAVWAPMVLAVAWAAGQHWSVPALSVRDMIRWHGAPNALAFVLAGLAATRAKPRRKATVSP